MKNQTMATRSRRTKNMVLVAMLGAITFVLGLTPLGFVPIGPLNATTMHIPVIIGAILEGPVVGALVGLIFGLSSLFNAITRPTAISFVFYNPLISIVPRILLGLITGLVYQWIRGKQEGPMKALVAVLWVGVFAFLGNTLYREIVGNASPLRIGLNVLFIVVAAGAAWYLNGQKSNVAVMITAFGGTLLHSFMVMGGIYLLYAERWLTTLNIPFSVEEARSVIFGVIVSSGVPEGILAVVVVSAVVAAIGKGLETGR